MEYRKRSKIPVVFSSGYRVLLLARQNGRQACLNWWYWVIPRTSDGRVFHKMDPRAVGRSWPALEADLGTRRPKLRCARVVRVSHHNVMLSLILLLSSLHVISHSASLPTTCYCYLSFCFSHDHLPTIIHSPSSSPPHGFTALWRALSTQTNNRVDFRKKIKKIKINSFATAHGPGPRIAASVGHYDTPSGYHKMIVVYAWKKSAGRGQ